MRKDAVQRGHTGNNVQGGITQFWYLLRQDVSPTDGILPQEYPLTSDMLPFNATWIAYYHVPKRVMESFSKQEWIDKTRLFVDRLKTFYGAVFGLDRSQSLSLRSTHNMFINLIKQNSWKVLGRINMV
ncbi:hypothetical protein HDU76_011407 [Blyttiomyces sp. JEL0837]|nr:hypothetical protein HDU76_011407 [Blyttiomyces sp. JEL0837]